MKVKCDEASMLLFYTILHFPFGLFLGLFRR